MRILLVDDADIYQSIPLPPLPPPPPPPFYARESSDRTNHKHVISTTMSVGASLLGTVLFLGVFCIVSRAYRRRQGNQRRREAGIAPTQEVFWDENQGPELDHPIWHIRTEGLHQSVIDAIAVFEYKKGEGLAEGTDCSVCLNEFEDDETLRLLPKCSHAFHLPCIDTWLRSHKNCPVCRAPVVKVSFDGGGDSSVPVASDLSSREAEIGNSAAGSSGSVGDPEGQDGALEVRIGDGNVLSSEEETNSGTGSSKLSGHVRVRSDLTEHREDVEAAIQPMRRSVSLDSFSAVAIYAAVSQAVHGKQPGNLDSTKQSKRSRAEHLNKRGTTGSLSFRKLMTSSLIGKSLQMGPISMKKSFSSSGKSSLSSSSLGDSRRRDPILPLRR